jgi:hypothetical protein
LVPEWQVGTYAGAWYLQRCQRFFQSLSIEVVS